MLTIGSFSATIEKGCWGIDGFFSFTVIFLLLSALCRRGLSLARWIPGYFFGIFFMFALNVLRVLLLISIGAWAQRALGPTAAQRLLRSFVHPHLAWLLYIPGMLLYFQWYLRIALKNDRYEPSAESCEASR